MRVKFSPFRFSNSTIRTKQFVFVALGVCFVASAATAGRIAFKSMNPRRLADLYSFVQLESDTANNDTPSLFPRTKLNREPQAKKPLDRSNVPAGYKATVELDSTLQFHESENFGGVELGVQQDYSLDEYLSLRRRQLQTKVWDSLSSQYDLKAAPSEDALSRVLSSATGLTIPLPPNPLTTIFGKPEVSINVSGEVNVRAGWRWDSQNLGTVSAFGQTQSSPMFSQDIRLNVNGRIGDKLKLGVDYNTNNPFEFNNRFKIGFDGYDDDIIKRVEVGNVSLQTPSTLIGAGQTLFGARGDFQFGPLFIKTLASQRRGERKFVNVKGGSLKQRFQLRAYDYAQNHFFLDTVYKPVFREYYRFATPVVPNSSEARRLTVKEIEVYESTTDLAEVDKVVNAIAYDNLALVPVGTGYDPALKNGRVVPGSVEAGRFTQLERTRYEFNPNIGKVTINNLRRDRNYAVAYRIEGNTDAREDDQQYGTFSKDVRNNDTLILKLIYATGLQPGFKNLWARQLRNIYPIGATNVDLNQTDINVWYLTNTNDSTDILPGATDKVATVLRVDQINNATGDQQPDGKFDVRSSGSPFFDPQRGEVTFPSLEPFREELRNYFSLKGNPALAEQYVYNEVYDTLVDVAKLQTGRDRFLIAGEATGTAGGSSIPLGAFNLTPGSVRVNLNGRPLVEGQDFTVDYYSGQVRLSNPQATLPNANLNIEYESPDIFNLTTRTLAGVRADYQLFKYRTLRSNIGFTSMFYNQALLIDRVRLGDEPVSNFMYGFDGNLELDAPWLTKAIDWLPLIDTKEKSSFMMRGEWAMMNPTPNKKLSEVASDNGLPVVYIDDFESAQRPISLGLTASQWTHASPPLDSLIAIEDSDRANYRGKSFWYQFFIARTPVQDVYPNRQRVIGQSNINDLRIDFDPNIRGIYNRNKFFVDSLNPVFGDNRQTYIDYALSIRPRVWGGIQRLLSSYNTNFDAENIDYIEIMMNVEDREETTEMYIDLGQISEDVIPNGRLNTEDGITEEFRIPNGIIDPGEDVGIDGVDDAAERDGSPEVNEPWRAPYPYPLNLESDPARDNYSFNFSNITEQSPKDFENYNNYEGNSTVSENGQFPDTEILNRNNGQRLAQGNSYFSYKINLDPNPATNPQIVGGANSWRLYRIPIRGDRRTVGNPLLSNVQYVRVWYKGGRLKARIADWRFLGSQWQRISTVQPNVSENDSVLRVSFINREENAGAPDYYTMPPGVVPPRQLTNPDPTQDIRLNEQSLAVSVRNLRYGDERMAVRVFIRPFDMFYYKQLKFFIHGDGSLPGNAVPGSTPPAYAFIRFGIDSLNYYEYRRPLTSNWQDLGINLEELTAIKQLRANDLDPRRFEFPVPNDPLAVFAIKGNPTLTKVQFVGFGIANPPERFPNDLTTTMWVNELRLIQPEDRKDWAAVGDANLQLADLGVVRATFNRTTPNFHRLEERFGNRIDGSNWSISTEAGLERFFPKTWKEIRIPISYTHTEFLEKPQFVAQNDINLEEAAEAAERNALLKNQSPNDAQQIGNDIRRRSQTLRVEDQFAITGLRLPIPTDLWWIRDSFNKLTYGYTYNQTFERSPVVVERFNWHWNARAQYAITIPADFHFDPLSWLAGVPVLGSYSNYRINFLPSTFAAGIDIDRWRTTEQSRYLLFPSPVQRSFTATKNAQFSWRLGQNGFLNPVIDYSVSSASTLVPFELDEEGRQRTGAEVFRQIMFKNGKFVDFGNENDYKQNITMNFRPKLPDLFSINKFFESSGSFVTNYTWRDPLEANPDIRDAVKQVGFQNTIRVNNTLRLRALGNTWFGETAGAKKDSAAPAEFWSNVGSVFKTIFLDYDNLTLAFTQNNAANNPGAMGGTGITNFWARGLMFREQNPIYGPSLPYQLGLVGSPHGSFSIRPSAAFPFFRFETDPGLRPPNATMQESFTQTSSIDARTARPLWEGATLDLNWKTQFTFNKNQLVDADDFGRPSFSNVNITESYNRTYFSVPTFLTFGLFGNTVEDVIDLYTEKKNEIQLMPGEDSTARNARELTALNEAFRDGLEFLNFFPAAIRSIAPVLNYGIRWEGIEKWSIFKGVARRISFEHMYASTYQENARVLDNGRVIEVQQVQAGFQPLIGLTMAFDETKLDGNLTASLRYNPRTGYQLSAASRQISRETSHEFSLQASYSKRRFTFPLFGFQLDNDVEFSFLTSLRRSLRATYDLEDFKGEDGQRLNGSTQIIIEPRARYNVSNRLTATAFVRYEGNFTEGAATPGFSNTQVGIDFRLSVAGGR
ncbi:MAG TPA: cell surface protein SprA [Patescibacteria group bacterium]|nr:cell surface protein SprA [Patescibacteria group bacterium]